MAEKAAKSSQSKAENQVSVSDSFLEKKERGDQDWCTHCWRTPPTCVSEAPTARKIGAPGTGCTRMGMAERMSQARRKAASRDRVQSNSLPGPLRVLVRGARRNAAFLINFL